MVKHELEQIDADKRRAWCKGCQCYVDIRLRSDTKRWRCQTSERYNDRLRKYGLTQAEYNSLYALQLGGCGICGVRLDHSCHVDHDHETQRVRGLLCSDCNTGMGLFKDDRYLLLRAAQYIKDSNVHSSIEV